MTESDYSVRFTGDYFSMVVSVQATEGSEDDVIHLANNIVKHHYGFDALAFATVDVEVLEA